MIINYILDADGHPVPCMDVLAWAKWFETSERLLAVDEVGPFRVSTVFLGIDHRMVGKGPPLLWETMIFTDDKPRTTLDYVERYASQQDALEGHRRAIAYAKRERP